jgi:hypothetical protein
MLTGVCLLRAKVKAYQGAIQETEAKLTAIITQAQKPETIAE